MQKNNILNKFKLRIKKLFTKKQFFLLRELIRANFMVTDHNSFLGIFWSFLGPLTLLVAMYFIFRVNFGSSIQAYPLFLLIGVVLVNFFITSTLYSTKMLVLNREFVLNTITPRETLILSGVAIYAYKFLIELAFCYLLGIFYKLFSWGNLLLLFPLLIACIGLAIGISFIFSLLYCLARDTEHIWTIMSRLLLFATPVFYKLEIFSSPIREGIYWLNPLTPFLISFREIIMAQKSINIFIYIHSLCLGVFFFILGYLVFIKFEAMAVEGA